MLTPSTKLKSQGVLGAQNVPDPAFASHKHWVTLISENRFPWLSLTLSRDRDTVPYPPEGDGEPPFDGSGSNHHPFSSPPPLASVQLLLIYTPDRYSRLQPSVPYNHFHVGHPYNNSSWPDTVAGLMASQEGFFIEHQLNRFYLFLTTCFNLPPLSFNSLTKAKCRA